ncbi:CubicO group peptidase (beta-lactamase class C family) [Mycobacterium sp. URHB0021]
MVAAVWLLLLMVAVAAHRLRNPTVTRNHGRNPKMAHFYGAAPMALLTAGAGAVLVGRELIGERAAVHLTGCCGPRARSAGCSRDQPSVHDVHPVPGGARRRLRGWLMPVVPPMVSADGSPADPAHGARNRKTDHALELLRDVRLSLVASIVIITMIGSRLATSGTARVPRLADDMRVFAILYGVPVWGFAVPRGVWSPSVPSAGMARLPLRAAVTGPHQGVQRLIADEDLEHTGCESGRIADLNGSGATMLSARKVIAAATALIAIAALSASPAAAEPATDLAAQLDAGIQARIEQMGVPGAVVALSIPGEIDYVKAFGIGDTATGIPMTSADRTRIGSVTKTFVGTAVLQLVDQGRIRLSDPISRYVDGVPNGDALTLDLLGRMRSGLPDYSDSDAFLDRLYTEAPTGPDAFAITPRQLVDWAFEQPTVFAPGTQWKYGNTNLVLLGMVVERVSGVPLGDYLQQNIFGPLGLAQTSYPANGLLPGPYAHGYNKAPDGTVFDATLWNPQWADAAGKIVSSTADLRTWAAALGKGTLLQPDTQAHRIGDGSYVTDGVDYAFAIFNAHGWIGHNGDIPGYTTVSVYLPERDATLVVSVNSDIPQPTSADQIATVVTSLATPDHVYELGPQPPQLVDDDS